ncbi:MAG: Lcl C-terminal domain-containing protein [Gemmatimonadota bacterium]
MKKGPLLMVIPLVVIAILWWWSWPSPCCNRWSELISSNRFAAALDGTAFLDRETGLVWEVSQDALQREWVIAREVCMNKSIAGRKGWRLPAFNELTSLLDPSRTNSALPAGHPFQNVQNSVYWSSSTSALAASPGTHAVAVDFGLGDVSMVNKSNQAWTKCVRGVMAGPTIY